HVQRSLAGLIEGKVGVSEAAEPLEAAIACHATAVASNIYSAARIFPKAAALMEKIIIAPPFRAEGFDASGKSATQAIVDQTQTATGKSLIIIGASGAGKSTLL